MGLTALSPTSNFIRAEQFTRPKKDTEKVYIYVEDDIDKYFWRKILDYDNHECSFVIKVYQKADIESRGKDAIMKDVLDGKLKLGSNILVCLDADLDFIVNNYHSYTEVLQTCPFIITTIWYSIENIKCYPENLLNLLYITTLADEINVDISTKVSNISTLIFRLFNICLLSYELKDGYYSIDNFGCDFGQLEFDENGDVIPNSITRIDESIKRHIKYEKQNREGLKGIKARLINMGYSPKEYYKIIRGHDLVDKIVIPLIKAIAIPIRTNRLRTIGGLKVCKKHKTQLESQYNNQTGVTKNCGLGERIKSLIRDSYDMESVDVVDRIRKKIKKALVYEGVSVAIEGIRRNIIQYNNNDK